MIRKKSKAVLLAVIVALNLSACGVALENRSFPLSMGVDYLDGQYQVYYGLPDLSGVTGQSKDGENQKAGEKADFYQGRTMEDAEKDFQNSQEDYLDTGHLKVLLLGNGLLDHEEAYKNLLHYLEDKPSIAGNIYVFSCAQLGDVMSMDGQQMDSLGDYLTGIVENRPDSQAHRQTDLQDLYNAWHNGEERPALQKVSAWKIKLCWKRNRPGKIRQYSVYRKEMSNKNPVIRCGYMQLSASEYRIRRRDLL